MLQSRLRLLLQSSCILFSLQLLSACEKSATPSPDIEKPVANNTQTNVTNLDPAALNAFWQGGFKALSLLVDETAILKKNISLFLDAPTQSTLDAARNSWQQSALTYQQFFAFRIIGINQPTLFPQLSEIDFRIAAYPIQPGSLDYWGPYKFSGLVHDIGNPISIENLIALHGQVDSENATLGLFAIQYMLFGEDDARPPEDYQPLSTVDDAHKTRGFKSPDELPNNRRRELLDLQASKLVSDVQLLLNAWNTPASSSPQQRWRNLAPSNHRQILSSTLEQGLNQLLVESATGRQTEITIAAASLEAIPDLVQHSASDALNQAFGALTANDNQQETPEAQLPLATRLTNILNLLKPVNRQEGSD